MAVTASGARALLAVKREVTAGVAPGGNWNLFSVSRYSLGATQNFLENDQIGTGRDAQHRTRDIKETAGQLTAPADLTDMGLWLTLMLGDPVTTGGPTNYVHSWSSSAVTLPSFAIEEQHKDLDTDLYFKALGVRGGSFNFRMEPRGHASIDIALIAQTIANAQTVSVAGTPARLATFDRFSQFENAIEIDPAGGTAWVPFDKNVSASLTFDNRPETVYYLGGQGQPGDINLQVAQLQGEITARLSEAQLFTLADAGTKFAMRMGWYRGASFTAAVQALIFTLRSIQVGTGAPRVEGASGIETTFQWSGGPTASLAALSIQLKNQYSGAAYLV